MPIMATLLCVYYEFYITQTTIMFSLYSLLVFSKIAIFMYSLLIKSKRANNL